MISTGKLSTIAISIVSAIAAAISIYIFFSGSTSYNEDIFEGNEYIYSPYLAIEFYQNNIKREITTHEKLSLDGGYIDVMKVSMQKKPFSLRIPKSKNNAPIRIVASNKEDIFQVLKTNMDIKVMPYFSYGSDFAQTGHYNPVLFLFNHGHHHLTDDRMILTQDNKYEVFFSKTLDELGEHAISEINSPIYMIVFYDKDDNKIIDSNINRANELELFVLNFE